MRAATGEPFARCYHRRSTLDAGARVSARRVAGWS